MNAKPSFAVRTACILWPSFLMAGVTEMLVFALVDPASLQWFGSTPVELSSSAVYSLAFFVFWLLISTAGAMTQMLLTLPAEVGEGHPQELPETRP
jgi:hypothetical protein